MGEIIHAVLHVLNMNAFRNKYLDGLSQQLFSSVAECYLRLLIGESDSTIMTCDNGGTPGY